MILVMQEKAEEWLPLSNKKGVSAYFHQMPLPRKVMLLLCAAPLSVQAQSLKPELPLPRTDGACIVIKVRYDFPWKPGGEVPLADTVGVLMVADDGYVRSEFLAHGGYCLGKNEYEVKDGVVLRKTGYKAAGHHSPFAKPSKHIHQLAFEETWTYKDGRPASLFCTAGIDRTPTLKSEYEYDADGRVSEEHNQFPPQGLIAYPHHYDEVDYSYDGDSVTRLSYEGGVLKDSITYLERHDSAGRLTERWEIGPRGKRFERERYQYDSSGRWVVYTQQRDHSPLRRHGKVLYADREERSYDERGRLVSERFFARELKRWEYRYFYLE